MKRYELRRWFREREYPNQEGVLKGLFFQIRKMALAFTSNGIT
jgi:hypothetical protein